MKGNARVIAILNDLLTNELTATNQYLAHAKLLSNWGYKRLADKAGHESEGERGHAGKLIERILFLDGVPDLQKLGPIRVGQTVPEQLAFDRQLEGEAVAALNKGIEECRAIGDHGTFEMLIGILTSEEEHIDWLETQLELIRQLGEAHYLAQQIRE
jgi:bacterioferritin